MIPHPELDFLLSAAALDPNAPARSRWIELGLGAAAGVFLAVAWMLG
jgi:hypothetical protein